MTHDLYKWQRKALANDPENPRNLKRSKSAGQLSAIGNDSSFFNSAGDEGLGTGAGAGGGGGATGNGGYESHDDYDDPTLDIKKIRTPGGFRRNYLHRQHIDNGSIAGRDSPLPQRPQHHRATSS